MTVVIDAINRRAGEPSGFHVSPEQPEVGPLGTNLDRS